MKKIISFFLAFLSVVQIGCGQQVHYQISPSAQSGVPVTGDTFKLQILNPHDYSIKVFPMWNRIGSETALRNNESLKNWYLSHLEGTDSLQERLSLIRATADMHKTSLFKNAAVPWSAWGSPAQCSKKFSPIGMKHSLHDRKCGDAAEGTLHDLILTEFFRWNHFKSFGAENVHSILGFSNNPAPASLFMKIDNDEGMPGFVELNPFNPNGYASVQEIIENPLLITDQYYWTDPNSGVQRKFSTFRNLEQYRNIFNENIPWTSGEYTETTIDEMSGEWILPPGTVVSWEYSVDEKLLDSTGFSNELPQWSEWATTGHQDSVVISLMNYTGMTESEATQVLLNEGVTFYDGEHFQPYEERTGGEKHLPFLSIFIPAQPTSVIFGEDLSFPFIVHRITSSGPITLGNSTVQNAEYLLYDTIGETDGPIVPDNYVNYLNNGKIPAGIAVTFTAYFNPGYYTFWEGMKFEVEGNDTLIFQSEYVTDFPVSLQENANQNVGIYPNPVHSGSAVPFLKENTVWDLSGKRVESGSNAPQIPGIYFVKTKSGIHKFVVIP